MNDPLTTLDFTNSFCSAMVATESIPAETILRVYVAGNPEKSYSYADDSAWLPKKPLANGYHTPLGDIPAAITHLLYLRVQLRLQRNLVQKDQPRSRDFETVDYKNGSRNPEYKKSDEAFKRDHLHPIERQINAVESTIAALIEDQIGQPFEKHKIEFTTELQVVRRNGDPILDTIIGAAAPIVQRVIQSV